MKASLFGLVGGMQGVTPDTPAENMIDILTKHLIQQERSLLVIDNLDSEQLSPLVYKLVNGMWIQDEKADDVAILITSRLKGDILEEQIGRINKTIDLGSFAMEEGVEFLQEGLNEVSKSSTPRQRISSKNLVAFPPP